MISVSLSTKQEREPSLNTWEGIFTLLLVPYSMGCLPASVATCQMWLAFCLKTRRFTSKRQLWDLLQALILLKTEAFQNLCMFMISLALFVCFVMKRLQFQGESFQPLAFIPVSNPSNLRAKMSSFTTSIPDLPCIDLRSLKKQKAKSLHMHCRQLVCMIFLILHGENQLVCFEVTFHRASFQPRILAREWPTSLQLEKAQQAQRVKWQLELNLRQLCILWWEPKGGDDVWGEIGAWIPGKLLSMLAVLDLCRWAS